jgi:hypothetical protein
MQRGLIALWGGWGRGFETLLYLLRFGTGIGRSDFEEALEVEKCGGVLDYCGLFFFSV